MLFAISDIHGCYEVMEKRINQIKPLLNNHNTIAVLLISANTTCTKSPSAILCAYSF